MNAISIILPLLLWATALLAADKPEFICHGAGHVSGIPISNSMEALEYNYNKGARYFEIDINWTRDEKPVLVHDWEEVYKELFPGCDTLTKGTPPTLAMFKRLKMKHGLTPLSLNDALSWLNKKHDAFFITDVKTGNIRALEFIKNNLPGFATQVIPQIYNLDEHRNVMALGYRQVILTLYKNLFTISPDLLIDFSKSHDLFAVTLPVDKLQDPRFSLRLKAEGLTIYAHTVNNEQSLWDLKRRGVHGCYTDTMNDLLRLPLR